MHCHALEDGLQDGKHACAGVLQQHVHLQQHFCVKQLQTPAHLPSRKGTDRACPRQILVQENGLLKECSSSQLL